MESSSIYCRCPACAGLALLDRRGKAVRCAACGYDYTALAGDAPAFEEFLVERLRGDAMEKLSALAVHAFTSELGAEERAAEVRALAARHGIALPEGGGDPVLRVALVAAAALVTLVAVGVAAALAAG